VPDYFQRYGFTSSPFVLRELDPVRNKADEGRLCRDIDGFNQLGAVEGYLKERVGSSNSPAFVLITGSEKSGLTTAANAVLAMYRDLRQLSGRFTVVNVQAFDHSELDLYRRWAAALSGRLASLGLQLDDRVRERLFKARLYHDEKTIEYELQEVVQMLAPALEAGQGKTFASCLEKLMKPRMIEIALVAFEGIPTVCVFTKLPAASDFDVDKFAVAHPEVHVLRLGYLNAQEVSRILDASWGKSSPVPFDVDKIGEFCERRKHSIGVVLTVAERLLKKKVGLYEQLKLDGSWPQDPKLGFDALNTLEMLEVVINGGS
jgi:hypothetical protein